LYNISFGLWKHHVYLLHIYTGIYYILYFIYYILYHIYIYCIYLILLATIPEKEEQGAPIPVQIGITLNHHIVHSHYTNVTRIKRLYRQDRSKS
jgi:hypothetical protein